MSPVPTNGMLLLLSVVAYQFFVSGREAHKVYKHDNNVFYVGLSLNSHQRTPLVNCKVD